MIEGNTGDAHDALAASGLLATNFTRCSSQATFSTLTAPKLPSLLERSVDLQRQNVAASGVPFPPNGPQSTGGWPLTLCAHCTLSRKTHPAPSPKPTNASPRVHAERLRALLHAGHAAAVTYVEMAARGTRKCASPVEQGDAVAHSVAAVQHELSNIWFAIERSQGDAPDLFQIQADSS